MSDYAPFNRGHPRMKPRTAKKRYEIGQPVWVIKRSNGVCPTCHTVRYNKLLSVFKVKIEAVETVRFKGGSRLRYQVRDPPGGGFSSLGETFDPEDLYLSRRAAQHALDSGRMAGGGHLSLLGTPA